MGKNIFVTGATGFIGSNLVRKLCKRKKDITIFVPKNSTHPLLKGLRYKRKEGDVRDYKSVIKAMEGCDYVYHLVGLTITDPNKKDFLFDVNVKGTENVMKACLELGVKKVVYVSSTSVLGFSNKKKKKLSEKDNLKTFDSIYSESKKKAEQKVSEYCKKGVNGVIVIPCSVIGAGEKVPSLRIKEDGEINSTIRDLVKNILKHRIKFTFPGGSSYIAVSDVVDGLMLAMKKGIRGERYILCSRHYSHKENYNQIAKIIGAPLIKFEVPKILYYPLFFLALIIQNFMENPFISTSMLKGGFSYRIFDTTKARNELGWNPKVTYQEAYREAISFYREQKLL